MHEPITTTVLVSHGGLAVFGAFVHALKAHRDKTSKGLLDLLILTAMSTFSGVMFAIAAGYFFPHQMYLSHAASGAGGFLGVEGLTLLALKIRDLISK